MTTVNFSGEGKYEIRVKGHIDDGWSHWFEEMRISMEYDEDNLPITVFTGVIQDQAALHGVIARIRDIHMPLISVNQIKPGNES